MKNFYTQNMKLIHKFLLNQIALSLFGFMTIIAMSAFGNVAMVITTVFAAAFFACLLYDSAWDEGARDRNKITNGRLIERPLHGVKVALFSYIPTYFFLIPCIILNVLSLVGVSAVDDVFAVFLTLNIFLCNGMFLGFSRTLAGIFPHTYSFFFIAYLIPAILAYGLGYYLGTKDIQLKTFLGLAPTTDEPQNKKK